MGLPKPLIACAWMGIYYLCHLDGGIWGTQVAMPPINFHVLTLYDLAQHVTAPLLDERLLWAHDNARDCPSQGLRALALPPQLECITNSLRNIFF